MDKSRRDPASAWQAAPASRPAPNASGRSARGERVAPGPLFVGHPRDRRGRPRGGVCSRCRSCCIAAYAERLEVSVPGFKTSDRHGSCGVPLGIPDACRLESRSAHPRRLGPRLQGRCFAPGSAARAAAPPRGRKPARRVDRHRRTRSGRGPGRGTANARRRPRWCATARRAAPARRAVRGQGQHRHRRRADHAPPARPSRTRRRARRRGAAAARGRARRGSARPTSTSSPPGWSAPARPTAGRRSVCRPASASAAARARARRWRSRAGIVPFALGTDTAGSGRVPAGFNQHRRPEADARRVSTSRRRAGLPQPRLRVDLRAHGRRRGARAGAWSRARTHADAYSEFVPGPARLRAVAAHRRARACRSSAATPATVRAYEAAVAHVQSLGHTRRGDRLLGACTASPRCSTTVPGSPSAMPSSQKLLAALPGGARPGRAQRHRKRRQALGDRRLRGAVPAARSAAPTRGRCGARSTC